MWETVLLAEEERVRGTVGCRRTWLGSAANQMEFERYEEWNVWRRQKNTREWTTNKYRRLEATSCSVFVDKLPIDVSKKELFHLFKWSGWINDIYLDRKVKEGKTYLFAFVRFTTKDGALKAIAEMDNINLRGNKLSVKEAYYRGDYGYRMGDHAELTSTTGRVVKKVNEREFDPAEELVINIRCEDTMEDNRVLVSEEILDE
ncbi:hypothetical protein PIB30_036305 [Stylosanthes scabra]|uniref:RRM domain-containing protein n=1 Tax=Stylosanthes scabra TaxID=79078 RepID=A0ABU6SEM3_9FABA|nr:hypothetical protein [Stylosanthes scabra]